VYQVTLSGFTRRLAHHPNGTGRIAVLSDDGTFDLVSGSHIVSDHGAVAWISCVSACGADESPATHRKAAVPFCNS